MSLVNIEESWFHSDVAAAICNSMTCADCGCWDSLDDYGCPGCTVDRSPKFEDIPRMLHSAHLGRPSPATTKLCEYFGVLPNEPFRFWNEDTGLEYGPLTNKYRITDSGEFQEQLKQGCGWVSASGALGAFSGKRMSVYHMPKYSERWKEVARGVQLIYPNAVQIKLDKYSDYSNNRLSVRIATNASILTTVVTFDLFGTSHTEEKGPMEWTFLEDIIDEESMGGDSVGGGSTNND